MPTYTGARKTTTYLQKQDLQHAAQNNHKITSFFTPGSRTINKTKAHSAGHICTPSPVIAPPGADVTPPDDPQLIPSQLATQSFNSLPPNPPPADATSDSAVTDVLEADNLAPTIFLDTTEDDNDITESISVLETVKKLTIEARKYKSFTSLFHLNSLKQFIELWEQYK